MDIQQKGIIQIIKCAITGEKQELPEGFDMEAAANVAKRHQISALVYYGALNCGVNQSLPAMQKLFTETCCHISISAQQLFSVNAIFDRFNGSKIEYMPLKGTLLKKLYPREEMRVMSDADILIRTEQYEKIRPIMTELGYTETIESDHELIWRKPGISIELHKRLIPSYNKDYYKYFGDGWQLGTPLDDTPNRFAMTPEDQMIYLFTHFAKHYRDAGIGIKHIVDLWVYRRNNGNLDIGYINNELEKLQLKDFYVNVMKTLDVWFENAASEPISELISQTVFDSGVYGTHESHILFDAIKASQKSGGKKNARINKVLSVLFVPYDRMCEKYPILKKAAFLLPVMWVYRWFEVVLFKRHHIKRQNADLKIMSGEKIDIQKQALDAVGLSFNFEE